MYGITGTKCAIVPVHKKMRSVLRVFAPPCVVAPLAVRFCVLLLSLHCFFSVAVYETKGTPVRKVKLITSLLVFSAHARAKLRHRAKRKHCAKSASFTESFTPLELHRRFSWFDYLTFVWGHFGCGEALMVSRRQFMFVPNKWVFSRSAESALSLAPTIFDYPGLAFPPTHPPHPTSPHPIPPHPTVPHTALASLIAVLFDRRDSTLMPR